MNDPLEALLKMIGDTTLFPPNSRYHAVERALLEQAGHKIPYLRRRFLPQPGRLALLVEHSLNEGDRLDLLSAQYLTDAALFWRICDSNQVLHPAEATRQPGQRLRIPVPGNPTGSEDG